MNYGDNVNGIYKNIFAEFYILFYEIQMSRLSREKFSKINVTQNNHNVANQVGVCKNYLIHDVQVKDPLI